MYIEEVQSLGVGRHTPLVTHLGPCLIALRYLMAGSPGRAPRQWRLLLPDSFRLPVLSSALLVNEWRNDHVRNDAVLGIKQCPL